MRISLAIPLLSVIAASTFAHPGSAAPSPTPADRNETRWAEWEAQARITDGDYDGAVQAEQQANVTRHEADRPEIVRPSNDRKRPQAESPLATP
jgi:hypothetical protein